MLPESDFILGASAAAAVIGASLRHFIPAIFKSNFWSLQKNSSSLSIDAHEKLCVPIRSRLDDGEIHFKEISDEVRYIRTLVVIQAPPEAIKKADEITGKRTSGA